MAGLVGQQSIADLNNNENIKLCPCGLDKGIFYCFLKCLGHSVYCVRCMIQHPHAPQLITLAVDAKNLQWSRLFEDIEALTLASTASH